MKSMAQLNLHNYQDMAFHLRSGKDSINKTHTYEAHDISVGAVEPQLMMENVWQEGAKL